MKVLQIMPDFELAGAQIMCETLVMELKKIKNIDVEIISFFNKRYEITNRLENNGIKIYYLNKRKGLDIKLINKLKKIIIDTKPNVIHTHRYSLEYIIPAVKLSKINDIKVVHTVHNIATKEVSKFLQIQYKIYFKKNLVLPVAISKEVKQTILNLYNLKQEQVPIIHNGIDLNKCIKKTNYELTNNLLHIGRFSKQKNHKELIDIFKECLKYNNNLILNLVGRGDLEKKVKKYVEKLNITNNVKFLGNMNECFQIINESDILLLPSKWEGLPIVALEAMGSGLPLVAYSVGGIPTLIDNKINGYLPSNKKEFINSIIELEKNINIRKKIGNNAYKKSILFSSTNMCKEYIKIYKS